jgi:hypothetical protein
LVTAFFQTKVYLFAAAPIFVPSMKTVSLEISPKSKARWTFRQGCAWRMEQNECGHTLILHQLPDTFEGLAVIFA